MFVCNFFVHLLCFGTGSVFFDRAVCKFLVHLLCCCALALDQPNNNNNFIFCYLEIQIMYSFLALSYSATSLVKIKRQWVEYELSELQTHNLNV